MSSANIFFLIFRSFTEIHLPLLLPFLLQTCQCFVLRCLSPLRSVWRLGLSRNRATWINCHSHPAVCLSLISSHLLFLHSWCFFALYQFLQDIFAGTSPSTARKRIALLLLILLLYAIVLLSLPFDSRLSTQGCLNTLSSILFGVILITSKRSLFIPNSLFSVDLAYAFRIGCFSLEG